MNYSIHKLSHLFRGNRNQRTVGSSLHDICTKSPSTTPILTRRIPMMGGSPRITERRLIKQTSLQLKTEFGHHPLYDSPPQENATRIAKLQQKIFNKKPFSEKSFSPSSADYNTINSAATSASNEYANLKNRTFIRDNSLEGPNEDLQQMPIPSAPPLSLIGSSYSGNGSRLQQKTIKSRFPRPALPCSNTQNIAQVTLY